MSSESVIGYFGVRYILDEDEIAALESRNDPRQKLARRAGLSTYWGNFSRDQDRFLLFIGAEICRIGAENTEEVVHAGDALVGLFQETRRRLAGVGITENPSLFLLLEPDI